MTRKRADVVDLKSARLDRLPAVTRFVLEIRDAGSTPHVGRFDWKWWTEDNYDAEGQWRPSTKHIGQQLRRIAARFDPRPEPVRRRHRVTRVRR